MASYKLTEYRGFFNYLFLARFQIQCYINEKDIQTLQIHINMLSLLQNSSLEINWVLIF